ncbi:MAG: hypothetical protein LAT68_03990 [Cyclobacteriaceae bacterium]|nr:hypothetical protein [Cyclobacteriaceae bacterium]MCH8515469.1 hypothetical protein [Cyclobacteriaceae bacterium]
MKDIKIKLESKKLRSGRCQVKFYLLRNRELFHYGYLLVEEGTLLSEVYESIKAYVAELGMNKQNYLAGFYASKSGGSLPTGLAPATINGNLIYSKPMLR